MARSTSLACRARTLTFSPTPEPCGIHRGHDGIRNFWDAMRAPWDWFSPRNGRVVKLSTHKSFEQALEAAGLSEQYAHADS